MATVAQCCDVDVEIYTIAVRMVPSGDSGYVASQMSGPNGVTGAKSWRTDEFVTPTSA
jgi:hypothetical protein